MLPRVVVLSLTVLIAAAPQVRGEDKAPVSVKALPPPAATPPAKADATTAHATSTAMLENITSTLPKFDPKAAAEPLANEPRPEIAPGPVFVLSTYIVRGSRPIEEKEVMTDQAREAALVKRYVGEPSDLDVALNKYTINTLWKKIPVLGRISSFASLSYGERIGVDYSKIEAQRKYTEALGVSADLPPAKPVADDKSK